MYIDIGQARSIRKQLCPQSGFYELENEFKIRNWREISVNRAETKKDA
jgi:hypothetical protein